MGEWISKFYAIVEDMTDNCYYITPPLAFLLKRFILMWFLLLGCVICSVQFFAIVFFIVTVLIVWQYKPVIHLWGVYYSKILFWVVTFFWYIACWLSAPFFREVISKFVFKE